MGKKKMHDLTAARQSWADYCRMRKLPDKECRRCGKTFPNDRQYFHVRTSGYITNICHMCEELCKTERVAIADAGPARADCPVCDTWDTLVIDHKGPKPVRMCRGCLTLIDMYRRPTRAGFPVRMNRVMEYALWQQGVPRQAAAEAIALMKTVPHGGLGQLANLRE